MDKSNSTLGCTGCTPWPSPQGMQLRLSPQSWPSSSRQKIDGWNWWVFLTQILGCLIASHIFLKGSVSLLKIQLSRNLTEGGSSKLIGCTVQPEALQICCRCLVTPSPTQNCLSFPVAWALSGNNGMGRCSKETNLPFNNPGWLGPPRSPQKMFNSL